MRGGQHARVECPAWRCMRRSSGRRMRVRMQRAPSPHVGAHGLAATAEGRHGGDARRLGACGSAGRAAGDDESSAARPCGADLRAAMLRASGAALPEALAAALLGVYLHFGPRCTPFGPPLASRARPDSAPSCAGVPPQSTHPAGHARAALSSPATRAVARRCTKPGARDRGDLRARSELRGK